MTERRAPDNSLAPLRNVTAFMTMLNRLQNRGMNIPGMGTFSGPAGWGKTSASIFAANSANAVLVQCGSSVNQRWLCEEIGAELGFKPRGSIAHMIKEIGTQLAKQDRALIIDEADHLVDKKKVEIVRDIYERSLSPVILIGEELLPQKLGAWERIGSRMLVWEQAEPCDAQDLKLLSQRLLPGRNLSEALSAHLLELCDGSLRRMATNLDSMRHHAELRGLDQIDLDQLAGFQFYTGMAPSPRKAL